MVTVHNPHATTIPVLDESTPWQRAGVLISRKVTVHTPLRSCLWLPAKLLIRWARRCCWQGGVWTVTPEVWTVTQRL